MDKVSQYQAYLITLLEKYASYPYANMPGVERQVITDTQRHHYQLVSVGWDKKQYVHNCSLHFDIKDGKIWLQQNWMDVDVAQELVEMGVPPTDIVLGFQPPYLRQYTDYGMA